MSEWLDNQKNQSSNFRQLLQERIEKAIQRRELTTEETKRLANLEAIAEKLKPGENVQSSGGVTHYLHSDYWWEINY